MNAPASVPAFNPLDPAFIADPYPTYRMLREQMPIWRSPLGAWVSVALSRHRPAAEGRPLRPRFRGRDFRSARPARRAGRAGHAQPRRFDAGARSAGPYAPARPRRARLHGAARRGDAPAHRSARDEADRRRRRSRPAWTSSATCRIRCRSSSSATCSAFRRRIASSSCTASAFPAASLEPVPMSRARTRRGQRGHAAQPRLFRRSVRTAREKSRRRSHQRADGRARRGGRAVSRPTR